MCRKLFLLSVFAVLLSLASNSEVTGAILFEELFDDGNFAARGWYDNTSLQLSTTEHIPGSVSSVEYHFNLGATTPASGGAIRKLFTESESVYVSFYIKHSANWTGSNESYHPHQFHFITNLDSVWVGPAYTYSTLYIETNAGVPRLGLQDCKNIDEANRGVDLTGITELRAIAGCNGNSDGTGNDTCYDYNPSKNGKHWDAGAVYFQHTPGAYYKNDWHFVEAYFQLNSIVGGIGIADGHVKYWYDGDLIIDYENIMLRTGEHPTMRYKQFLIAPYIGPGSPVAQTFWVDNLTVATSRPIVGDLNDDGNVNFEDFAAFALAWLSELGDAEWRLDCEISQPPDGVIDGFDLGAFVENWLSGAGE